MLINNATYQRETLSERHIRPPLIMVTITRDIFINIFQTEHISAVKFGMRYWEKYEFSCVTKIAKKFEKKVEKIGFASLKSQQV